MQGLFTGSSFVLLCLAAAATLASGAEIGGRVIDRTGAGIPAAMVQLIANGRAVTQTKTDVHGEFKLNPPEMTPGGDYQVLAAASGFAPAIQRAESRVELTLDVAPYRQAMEIQASIPASDALLDFSGVRESSAKDLGEALTSVDGVWKIRKAGIANDLVIRGFQQNNINVLVNGSRTYGACPSHMDPPAQHVDFAEVDHVEVTKGAFDVANQGSLGAVVNIVTKRPDMGFAVKPAFSFGSFGFYNPSITASYGNRAVRVLGGYSFRTSEPYKDGSGRRFTEYANYSAAGRDQQSFTIHTGWLETQFSLSDRQQLTVGYSRQQAGLILYPYLQMDSDYDNADRGTFRYAAQNLTSGLRNLRVEGYFTQVRHFMTDSRRSSAMMGNWTMAGDAKTRAIGGRVEGDVGRNWTAGVESYQREWALLGSMRMGGAVMVSPSIPDVRTQTLGAFVSYRRSLTERLQLTGGLRYDHAQMEVQSAQASTNLYYQFHDTRRTSNADNYVSGNARLSYGLPRSMEVFAGAGTSGRIPDAEERYISRGMGSGATVGNPLLPVTRNTETMAGWSLNQQRVYLRPMVFYSFLDNFILVNNQPQMNGVAMGGMTTGGMATGGMAMAATARSFTNVNARMYGGEMTYGVQLSRALWLNGGGSYSRGTVTPRPMVNVRSGNIPEMPPLRGWSALRYSHRWAYAEFGTVAANRQDLVSTDLKEAPTAGYAVLNFKVGFTHRKLSGSFGVDNLLNRYYYEHLSYYRDPFAAGLKVPEPGRNFFGQVRYTF